MVRRGIAEQDRFAFAAEHGVGDGFGGRADIALGWRCHTLGYSDRSSHIGQGLHPVGVTRQQGIGNRHGPIRGSGRDGVNHATFAYGLANALREQGMVLAQIRAHHQNALQFGQRRNRSAQVADAFNRRELGVA